MYDEKKLVPLANTVRDELAGADRGTFWLGLDQHVLEDGHPGDDDRRFVLAFGNGGYKRDERARAAVEVFAKRLVMLGYTPGPIVLDDRDGTTWVMPVAAEFHDSTAEDFDPDETPNAEDVIDSILWESWRVVYGVKPNSAFETTQREKAMAALARM